MRITIAWGATENKEYHPAIIGMAKNNATNRRFFRTNMYTLATTANSIKINLPLEVSLIKIVGAP
jgi:hypothetical protein